MPVDPRPFWVGTGDLTRRFGTALDTRALSCIAIRAFVGDADIETDEIHVQPHHADWMEGANDSGRTRIDRGRALVDAFRGCGADAQLILVPSCGHDHRALLPHALAFFDSILVG